MIKILLLLILPFFLYASKILNYNVYDRTDRVDIMITFDTPYSGIIKQKIKNSKIIITLTETSIESPKSKKVLSNYINNISFIPLENSTQVIATLANNKVNLLVSKTTDGYGLRLRFKTKIIKKDNTTNIFTNKTDNSLSSLPTKKDNNISKSYYIVVTILLIGIFILFYIKRRVEPKTLKPIKIKKQDEWLFESTKNKPQVKQEKNSSKENNVQIRFQKAINDDNTVVMLDFGEQSYLVLMGKSNILLDKFHDEKPTSQQEFESILQNRHEELEAFLSTSSTDKKNNYNEEPLQSYKEKAATLLYSDEQ